MSTVRQIDRMVKHGGDVLTVWMGASVAAAAQKMCANEVGCLIVVDGHSKAIGVITERDVISKVVAKSLDPSGTTVAEAMTAQIISCKFDMTVQQAQQIMSEHGIRHLPIIQNGVPVGMVSSRDVMAHRLSAAEAVVKKQYRILVDLEHEYPGITQLEKDHAGRIVI
jgi:signal-transduction protein with cAMP-binding, CBS, and nucleotidyltransferase domain